MRAETHAFRQMHRQASRRGHVDRQREADTERYTETDRRNRKPKSRVYYYGLGLRLQRQKTVFTVKHAK